MNISDTLLFTVNSIMPLILLILVGYLLKRIGFFKPEFLKAANKMVFYVCLPVLLFKNIADIEDLSQIRFDVVLYAVCIIALLLLIGWIMTFFIRDPRQKGVLHQCIFRSNFALIGVPLAELIGGSAGVRIAAILSLFTIPIFNISGVVVLSVYRRNADAVKNETAPNLRGILLGILKNPLIIGVVSGLIYAVVRNLLLKAGVPDLRETLTFPATAVSYIAKSATPLALIVLGGQFDFKKMSGYKQPLVMGLVGRNLIAPLLGVGVAAVLTGLGIVDFGPEIFAALIALFATPVAVASAVMAEAMDNDGQLAAQLVVWTSLFSIVSLFLFISVARYLGLL